MMTFAQTTTLRGQTRNPHRLTLTTLIVAFYLALYAVWLGPGCADTTYVFDDVEVGAEDDTREPRTRSNSQFIRSVYADVLGRSPEVYDFVVTFDGQEALRFPIDEQDVLLDVLDGVGDPTPMRAVITAGLVDSEEAALPSRGAIDDPATYIAEQFRHFLGREPSVYELDAFVREWQADTTVGPQTVIRALIGSREYQSF